MNTFPTYHKIQSIFKRDMNQKHRPLIMGDYTRDEFRTLANSKWRFTEKIDGTNIRIHWDGESVTFGGRTERAQIPADLVEHLVATFTPEKMLSVFGDKGGITLFGEGFGNKIQKVGSKYMDDSVAFILFDIQAGGIWFTRESVVQYSAKLNIPVVTQLGIGTLDNAIKLVAKGFESTISQHYLVAEGLIATPVDGLVDRLGNRIITKIKHVDFKDLPLEEVA